MRTRISLRALIALFLALTLVAAACGGSDDDSTDTAGDDTAAQDGSTDGDSDSEPAAEPEDDESGDTTADTTEDEPVDEPEPEDEPEEEPEEEPADEPVAPSGDAALFCARYAENQELTDAVDLLDPEQLENFLNTSQGLLAEAIADAPGELVPDLQLTLDAFGEFKTILEVYDYDFFAAADDVEAFTDNPELDAADDRIQAWIDANCPDAAGDDADADAAADDVSLEEAFANAEMFEAILGSDAGRALLAEELAADGSVTIDQANCFLDGLVEAGGVAGFIGLTTGDVDPEAVVDLIELFSACGIDFDSFG
ncbi:MAG: hypothetical protein AAGA90_21845 [Actinomycetota bacterium]